MEVWEHGLLISWLPCDVCSSGRVVSDSISLFLLQIKKFKDALAKHNTERCSLGPAKGLEESELLALAANKDLSFTYTRKPVPVPNQGDMAEAVPASPKPPLVQPSRATEGSQDKALANSWEMR